MNVAAVTFLAAVHPRLCALLSLLALAACALPSDPLSSPGCRAIDRESWVCFNDVKASLVPVPKPGEPLPYHPDSQWNAFVADAATEYLADLYFMEWAAGE